MAMPSPTLCGSTAYWSHIVWQNVFVCVWSTPHLMASEIQGSNRIAVVFYVCHVAIPVLAHDRTQRNNMVLR